MSATKKWMPFYVADYLDDTGHLSTLEHGAYFLILAYLWRSRKPIKDDANSLRRVTRTTPEEWESIRETITDLLEKTPAGWTQKRLIIEIERADRKYKNRVKVISDLNKKRKDLARSSYGKRADSRAVNRATTTLSKDRVVVGRGIKTPPPTTNALKQYETGFTDEHNRDHVKLADGPILKIGPYGAVGVAYEPRD